MFFSQPSKLRKNERSKPTKSKQKSEKSKRDSTKRKSGSIANLEKRSKIEAEIKPEKLEQEVHSSDEASRSAPESPIRDPPSPASSSYSNGF